MKKGFNEPILKEKSGFVNSQCAVNPDSLNPNPTVIRKWSYFRGPRGPQESDKHVQVTPRLQHKHVDIFSSIFRY